MAHTNIPGVAVKPAAFLDERDNQRAVDLIESAERTAPYCACGRHMIAVAQGDAIWLECSSLRDERFGLAGLVARITALGHTRRMIMELPR
jgi:hypothetical protein